MEAGRDSVGTMLAVVLVRRAFERRGREESNVGCVLTHQFDEASYATVRRDAPCKTQKLATSCLSHPRRDGGGPLGKQNSQDDSIL